MNNSIAMDTRMPIAIFLGESLSLSSDTLEQSVPTKMTDKILQDLTVITIG